MLISQNGLKTFLDRVCGYLEKLGSKSGWVGSGQTSLVWDWKIYPKNPKNFKLFPSGQNKSHWVGSKSTRVKDWSVSYLLRAKSILGLGQGPSLEKNTVSFISAFNLFYKTRKRTPSNKLLLVSL